MQVDNNLNSMMQLGNKLEKSANELAKLNQNSENSLKNQEQPKQNQEKSPKQEINEPDLVKEMVNQIQIPIAYDANAKVISTRDASTQTLLDIKA